MRTPKVFPLVALLISLTAFNTFGQKTKRIEIYKNGLYKDYIDVHYFYDDNNAVTAKQAVLYGQDLRYQGISKSVIIFNGSLKELSKFLVDLETFLSENEEDVSNTIGGCRITIAKQMGIKGVLVHEKDGLGYRGYNAKTLRKLKQSLSDWSEKNADSLE